jgi:hypothetical protein
MARLSKSGVGTCTCRGLGQPQPDGGDQHQRRQYQHQHNDDGGHRHLLGLLQIQFRNVGIWDGQHEARFARRGPIGTTVSPPR